MPQRLLITGASGYIGARLVALALQAGWEVAVLGSPCPGGPAPAHPWRLGEEPPPEALAGVSALLHLGHSWTGDGAGEANVNLAGADRLARAALSAGVEHFVFASTTSARAEALNNYGRVKHAIEQRLQALPGATGRIIIARIGLVYGGPQRGQYGLMSKLVDLSPVLPMIGLDRRVQPIHLDEVCEALLRLARDPPQDRQIVVVAGPEPVTFAAWLRTLRRARTGKGLILLPVPIGLALLACDLTRLVPFVPTVDRERVLGLAGAAPMASAADLAALGIAPADPAVKLAGGKAARRRALAEAAAMLRYVAGAPIPSAGPVIRLARALERDPRPGRPLPAFVLRWPTLMRLFEPWRPSMRHGLSRRLHLAAMVAEAPPPEAPTKGGSIAGAMAQLALEAVGVSNSSPLWPPLRMSEASFDPEFIVIGSGPAGVSAAVPLVAAGRRVLMIDGSGAAPLPPADAPSSISWQDMLGRGLEALQPDDALSPKLRTPTARNVIGAFQQWSNITTDNFLAVGALARGGLSRVWGGYVSEFNADDLTGWPITQEELRDSYRAITERIGVSGSTEDDMGSFHGRSGPILPAPPIGPATTVMHDRYRRAAPIAEFSLGLARNALLTLDRSDRRACDLSLSCLWGCTRGAIYDARYDLLQLCRSPSFKLVDQAIVTAIAADGAAWRLLTQAGHALRAPRVLLAAGTLGTLRLVAPLLADRDVSTLRLLNSPVQVIPLLVPSRLGRPSPQRGYTLAQLGYALRYAGGRSDYITGGLYEVAALPPSTFAVRLPLGRRAATELVRALASALVVATTYYPGSCSDNTVSWRREGNGMQFTIRGGFAPGFEQIVTSTRRRLVRILRRLGAWALPGAMMAPPGIDAHFGGLFPMGLDAVQGTTRYGELNAARGLFVVDASAHPDMPAKFNTLTIMANADRIGRHLASLNI